MASVANSPFNRAQFVNWPRTNPSQWTTRWRSLSIENQKDWYLLNDRICTQSVVNGSHASLGQKSNKWINRRISKKRDGKHVEMIVSFSCGISVFWALCWSNSNPVSVWLLLWYVGRCIGVSEWASIVAVVGFCVHTVEARSKFCGFVQRITIIYSHSDE